MSFLVRVPRVYTSARGAPHHVHRRAGPPLLRTVRDILRRRILDRINSCALPPGLQPGEKFEAGRAALFAGGRRLSRRYGFSRLTLAPRRRSIFGGGFVRDASLRFARLNAVEEINVWALEIVVYVLKV